MINYSAQKQKVVRNFSSREEHIRHRMYAVVFFCFLGFIVVLCRVTYLHLSDNDKISRTAESQYTARIPVSLRRGKIFDRNGSELAVSLPVPSIYVDPSEIVDPVAVAKKLGTILNISESSIAEKLAVNANRRFVWIRRRVSYETLQRVIEENIPGVHYIEESKRFYPNAELASQVLGAVGFDSQALAGIEMKMDDVLKSQKKSNYFKRDARGRMYAAPVAFGEQSDVGEVYLTIDKQIQFITEEALRDAVKKANANDGVAVVISPGSGDILAMASAPIFDPNKYSKYAVSNWRNRAVTDVFEPGSTFKVFVVAAALDREIVTPTTEYHCGNGYIQIGKNILRDHHPYGKLPVKDIIKYSSNIGSLKIAFDIGKEEFYKSLKSFGIGGKTDVDFPGEVGGTLRNYETWQPVEHATIAFGQGLTTTPLQMAAAFSAVVNGGVYYRPRLIARIIDRNGRVTHSKSEVVSRPISVETSRVMREMLARVVEKGGTGTKAHSDAYDIGGKTGTAQKVAGGGYVKGKYYSSFIGFAPVDDPKIVVLVGIDEPRGAYYGGAVAAPVVKEIIERSLSYMGVPSKKSPIIYAARKAAKPAEEPDIYDDAKKTAIFQGVGDGRFLMPDFTGLTLREVLAAAGDAMIETEAKGSGVVVAQMPRPGEVIKKGEKFTVSLSIPE